MKSVFFGHGLTPPPPFSNNVKKTALLVPDGFPQGHPTIKNVFFLFLNHCEENVHIWHKMLKIINYQLSPQKVF